MDNAFFSGAQNARNFLMQPQLERERMQDRQRRMAEEDLRLERARQAQLVEQQQAHEAARRTTREADIYARGLGLPGRNMGAAQGLGAPAPMGAPIQQPIAPMQAPEPQQGAYEDGGTVTVRGIRAQRPEPLETPSQADMLDQMIVAAYQDNDQQRLIELVGQRQTMMSEEEQRGRQLIGSAAVQILNMPPEERQAAVRMALEQFGVDPASTGIDDIADPAQLESALRFEAFRGDPEAWIKQQVETQGSRDEFRPFQRVDLGGRDVPFNPRTGTYGEGVERTASPESLVSAATARRGQDIQVQLADALRRHQFRMSRLAAGDIAGRQREQQRFQAEQNALNRKAAAEVATIRAGGGGIALGDIENDPMWEPVQ